MATKSVSANPAAQAIRPTKFNHVACDFCDKPITRFLDGNVIEREYPFGSMRYVYCKDCSRFSYLKRYRSKQTHAILRRALRFSKDLYWAIHNEIEILHGKPIRVTRAEHALLVGDGLGAPQGGA